MPERLGPSMSGISALLTVDTPPGHGVHSGGVDLVDVDRLGLAVTRSGSPLLRRLFDADERGACADGARPAAAAGLFGIKESVVKVLGGLPRGAGYRDMSIGVDAGGAHLPVRLSGELARWADLHRVEVIGGSAPRPDGVVVSWALALREYTSC